MPARVSLANVSTGGCSKPKCGHRAPINRHHRAHEALWLGAWAHRGQEPKWKAFVKRYYEYREEDIVRICLPHHAEIHSIYDAIIADDMARTGLPLYLYSWKQGKILMRRLTDACAEWLTQETPGIDHKIYEATKKTRRGRLRKNARRNYPRSKKQKETATARGQKIRREKKRRRRD